MSLLNRHLIWAFAFLSPQSSDALDLSLCHRTLKEAEAILRQSPEHAKVVIEGLFANSRTWDLGQTPSEIVSSAVELNGPYLDVIEIFHKLRGIQSRRERFLDSGDRIIIVPSNDSDFNRLALHAQQVTSAQLAIMPVVHLMNKKTRYGHFGQKPKGVSPSELNKSIYLPPDLYNANLKVRVEVQHELGHARVDDAFHEGKDFPLMGHAVGVSAALPMGTFTGYESYVSLHELSSIVEELRQLEREYRAGHIQSAELRHWILRIAERGMAMSDQWSKIGFEFARRITRGEAKVEFVREAIHLPMVANIVALDQNKKPELELQIPIPQAMDSGNSHNHVLANQRVKMIIEQTIPSYEKYFLKCLEISQLNSPAFEARIHELAVPPFELP